MSSRLVRFQILGLCLFAAATTWAAPTTITLDMPPGATVKVCTTDGSGSETCRVVTPMTPAAAAAAPAPPQPVVASQPAPEAAASTAPAASVPDVITTTTAKQDAFQQVSNYAEADISAPSSVASSILGISTDSAQRPGTIRDFLGSVVRGLGPDGKPVNAIALDVSPVSLFFKSQIRGGDTYAPVQGSDLSAGWLTRVAARTTVSLGSTAPDSNGASRSALGLRVGILDWGDPGLYADVTAKCVRALDHPPVPAGRTLDSKAFDMSSCDPTRNVALSLWAKPALYLAYGQSWYSKSGSLTDRAPDVKQLWLTYSQGFTAQSMPGTSRVANKSDLNSSLRVLGQVTFGRRLDDRTADPSDATRLLSQNSTQLIARLRAGMTNWHTFAELGRSRVTLGSDTTENLRHTAFGAEFKVGYLGDDSWLQLATVRERGFLDGKDHSGVTLNFRIGAPGMSLPGPAATTPANK
jgi:hypothetical protein